MLRFIKNQKELDCIQYVLQPFNEECAENAWKTNLKLISAMAHGKLIPIVIKGFKSTVPILKPLAVKLSFHYQQDWAEA